MPNWTSTPFEAAQRESGEKIGQVLAGVHLTGMPENSSERDGTARHEIVLILAAVFAGEAGRDPSDARQTTYKARTTLKGARKRAWPIGVT
jgi:ADP-ribose pyrophosphatase YjhB (NUDIX family)